MAPSPTNLWAERAEGDEHAWLGAGAPPPRARPRPREPLGPSSPLPRERRRGRRLAAVSAAVLALTGAGVAGSQLAGGGAAAERAAAPSPLPAVSGATEATAVNEIYAQAGDAVVSVQVTRGSGTGFLIDDDGTIVTNAHVVGEHDSARVRFDDDGSPVAAEVLGSDPSTDLAVLKVDASDVDVRPLALADSDDVRVGDQAVAIGYPLGLDRTATAGIVSGLGREIRAPNGFSIDQVIQTDAPINPGNSGGPLLDANSRVIGVNSQIATSGARGGNLGIGFAVPSNTVREVVPRLKAGQAIERPYLGLTTGQAAAGGAVTVAAVVAGSPAARAGLREGDTIREVDGTAVRSPSDVAAAIADRAPGERVEVGVQRGGAQTSVTVELGKRPERSSP